MIITIKKSKTGSNQCVQVYNPEVQQLLRDLVRSTPRGGRLFPFSYGVLLRSFKKACTDLGLSQRYTPHSLRHGGATYWRFKRGKSIESVMHRGRWASAKSARIYLDAGHALQSAMQASSRVALCGVLVSRHHTLLFAIAVSRSGCGYHTAHCALLTAGSGLLRIYADCYVND